MFQTFANKKIGFKSSIRLIKRKKEYWSLIRIMEEVFLLPMNVMI